MPGAPLQITACGFADAVIRVDGRQQRIEPARRGRLALPGETGSKGGRRSYAGKPPSVPTEPKRQEIGKRSHSLCLVSGETAGKDHLSVPANCRAGRMKREGQECPSSLFFRRQGGATLLSPSRPGTDGNRPVQPSEANRNEGEIDGANRSAAEMDGAN